jgi:hypothetical protein
MNKTNLLYTVLHTSVTQKTKLESVKDIQRKRTHDDNTGSVSHAAAVSTVMQRRQFLDRSYQQCLIICCTRR